MFTLMCHNTYVGFKCCTHSSETKRYGDLSQEDPISLRWAVFSHVKKEVTVPELANIRGTWLSLIKIASSWSLHCCCRWILDICLQLFLVLSQLSSTLTSHILAQSIWQDLNKTHHEASQSETTQLTHVSTSPVALHQFYCTKPAVVTSYRALRTDRDVPTLSCHTAFHRGNLSPQKAIVRCSWPS